MKKSAPILTAALLAPIVLLIVWGDQELEPRVAAALERPPPLPRDENLFYPLIAFDAAAGADPATAGHQAVTRVNRVIASQPGVDAQARSRAIHSAWSVPALALRDAHGVLCRVTTDGCATALAAAADRLRQVAADNEELLARYASLAGFPRFQSELIPDPHMPQPRLAVLQDVHRLVVASRLVASLHGDGDAHLALLADVDFLRRVLRQADNLLVTTAAASLLAETLHGYAAAMDGAGAPPRHFPRIAPLDAAELSMDAPLRGEFRFLAARVVSIHAERNIQRKLGIPPWLGSVGVRPLFKPNRTLNRLHACWQVLLARGSGEAAQQAQCQPRWHDWLLNPVGTILNSLVYPEYSRYGQRLADLAGLVTLVNVKRELRNAGVGVEEIPGFLQRAADRFSDPRGGPVRFDAPDRSLYFDSPRPQPDINRLRLDPLAP